MRGFLLNRLSQSLVLLVIVSIIGFTILSLIPGGPLSQYARDPSMTQQDIERLAEQLGLNRPIWSPGTMVRTDSSAPVLASSVKRRSPEAMTSR